MFDITRRIPWHNGRSPTETESRTLERYLDATTREHGFAVALLGLVLLVVNVAFGVLEIPLITSDDLPGAIVPVRIFAAVMGAISIVSALRARSRRGLRYSHTVLMIAVALTVFGLGMLYETPTPVTVTTVMAVYLVSSWAIVSGTIAAVVVSLGDLVPLLVWPESSMIVDYHGSLFTEYALSHLVAHILGAALTLSLARRNLQRFINADDQRQLAASLTEARSELSTMSGLLSACAVCHKINDNGEWIPLARYVSLYSGARVSHGYCPACSKDALREFDL